MFTTGRADLKKARELYHQYVYTNEKLPLYCANCRNMGVRLSHIEKLRLKGLFESSDRASLRYHQFRGNTYVLFIGKCNICKFSTVIHRVLAKYVPQAELQKFLSYQSLSGFDGNLPSLLADDLKEHEKTS